MAKVHGFSEDGAREVVETVRKSREYPADMQRRQQWQGARQTPILPTIAFAQEDVAAGATGTFYFAKGLPGEEVEDTTREIEVCNSTNTNIKDGMKCVIAWLMVEQSGGSSWHAIRVFSYVMIRGSLKTAMTSGDSTHTIDGISVMQGADPRTDPTSSTEEVTVYNVHGWDGDDNASAVAAWNTSNSHWELLQVTCPA